MIDGQVFEAGAVPELFPSTDPGYLPDQPSFVPQQAYVFQGLPQRANPVGASRPLEPAHSHNHFPQFSQKHMNLVGPMVLARGPDGFGGFGGLRP